MGLKQFIDSSPLVALVGVAVAVGSATAAVTGFFAGQRAEVERTEFKIEKDRIDVDTKGQIASLQTRLASIERRVGSEDRSFFDVTRLIVTPDRIKELDTSYKTMAGGAFFICEPPMKAWHYTQTSELAIMKEMLAGDGENQRFGVLEEVLSKKNIHLWRATETFAVHPVAAKGKEGDAPSRLNYFPYVLVQVLSDQDVQRMATAADKLFQMSSSKIDETLKVLEVTARDLDSASKPATSTSASASEVTANATAKAEETLTKLFRGDLVPILLTGVIVQNMQLAESYSNVYVELKTAQKKGNVLYLETRIEFADIKVDGRETLARLIVDQEWFVVTSPSAIVIVKVQIPSIDGRGESYSWTGEWLAGLRLPVK
jgi:hypothetical protein